MTPPGIAIRSLATEEERRAAVALQEATWGPGFSQKVPESVLWFVPRVGGVVAGAFEKGQMVGFLFGVTGWRDGAPLHWSDMLAVRAERRGAGIGLALKRWQRETLLATGVRRAHWTFDPLEAGNAHFNFARLGCTAGSYLRDVYGTSDSPLHAGLGTDRLVAEWTLDAPRVTALAAGEAASPLLPPESIPPFVPGAPPAGPRAGIEVPAGIQRLKREDPEAAAAWRARTREAFEAAFEAGWWAVGFERREGGGGVYLLEPMEKAGSV